MLKLNTTYYLLFTLVALIALLANQSANALNLQPTNQCKILINGTAADIALMDRPSGYRISSPNDPNFNFLINLCNAAPKPMLNLCENNSSAGYQVSTVYNLCYSMGDSANPKVSYSLATGKVTITHPPSISVVDGVKRQLEVSLECDRNAGNSILKIREMELFFTNSMEVQAIFVVIKRTFLVLEYSLSCHLKK